MAEFGVFNSSDPRSFPVFHVRKLVAGETQSYAQTWVSKIFGTRIHENTVKDLDPG